MYGQPMKVPEAVVRKSSVGKVWPRPATLLKKKLWHKCFPVNFAKFLRTSFFYRTPLVAAFLKLISYFLFKQASLTGRSTILE